VSTTATANIAHNIVKMVYRHGAQLRKMELNGVYSASDQIASYPAAAK